MRLAVIGKGFSMAVEVLSVETKAEGSMVEVVTADRDNITLSFEYTDLSMLFVVCMASDGSVTLDFRNGDTPENKHMIYVTAESMNIHTN